MSDFNLNEIPSQKGRLAIVTGANSGLGYETARTLAKKDIEVVMACRNILKAEKAKQNIKEEYPDAKIKCLKLDLSKLDSIPVFVELFFMNYQQLDLLINNAGIMMTPYEKTKDGFEGQMAANYFGHFLLTGLLLKTLLKTKGSRVITLSSGAHRWGDMDFDDLHFEKGYNSRKAYGRSKLACLMFAYELDRRLTKKGHQVLSVAAHPGITVTNLINHFHPVIKGLAHLISPLLFQSIEKGALPILRAALDPKVKSGEYYGPGGYREYKGHPVRVGSSSRSRDKEMAKKLWELSEELTGVKYFEK